METKQNIDLKSYTTFGIGGRAKFFCTVTSIQETLDAIAFAQRTDLPVFVLGGGSNVLISDLGFDGLVIKIEIKGTKIEDRYFKVGAGENWDDVVKKAIDAKLEGIECLSGIPGTFGGAIVQNIGAYGQTLSDVVDAVEVLDTSDAQIKTLSGDECGFEYRNSLFKKNPAKYIVVAAALKLNEIDRGNISYPSIKKIFDGKPASLAQVREAVIKTRAEKGMVILPEYESYKSAGSFFKNPVISDIQFDKIFKSISCPDPWYWPVTGGVKVAAACLVTQAGFKKGEIIDAAQISPRQPLAIINPGFATSKDIRKASELIKSKVREKFGVELEEEIIYVGKF